jgi:multiple sugar transport system substrate-binding protein
MNELTRRGALKLGAGAAAASAWLGIMRSAEAAVDLRFSPEPGAALKILRWEAFVPDEAVAWTEITRQFSDQTGVAVSLESVPWPSVQGRVSEAVHAGSGPDIIFGFYDTPQLYPDQLVDLTILATYLGEKYGGWYPVCERYGTVASRWIALPLATAGTSMVYRRSHVAAAGFAEFPQDMPGFLELCRALAKNGTPPGFPLGHAVGDANTFAHWLLWAFGGRLVDVGLNVVIDSSQTREALAYARELYQTFVPGTTSWLDPDNNEAFLSGAISLTQNGLSIYDAARNASDPARQSMAEDIEHAYMPVGPVGTPTELYVFFQAMVPGYSKFPNAAMEYLRFMSEREQYEPWQQAAHGYHCQALRAYEDNPVWSADPQYEVYKNCTARMLWNGFAGELGPASAEAMAQFIVVDMFAEAASGQSSASDAAGRAAKRANAIYRQHRL